jgi:hypothetical protein
MELVAAIVIAILLTAIFYFAFKTKGPWKTFWPFFIIILLIVWASALWLTPIGPAYWGIAWIPLLFIGLLMALLLSSMPNAGGRSSRTKFKVIRDKASIPAKSETGATTAIGILFWVFICLLLIAIIVGYFFMVPEY